MFYGVAIVRLPGGAAAERRARVDRPVSGAPSAGGTRRESKKRAIPKTAPQRAKRLSAVPSCPRRERHLGFSAPSWGKRRSVPAHSRAAGERPRG
jgi:hypothetical protein